MHDSINLCLIAVGLAIIWQIYPSTPLVKSKLEPEYDFIIVGAGSAGSVVAARLSEDPGVTVAVLEAGQEDTHYGTTAEAPLRFSEMWSSEADWKYQTVPQKHACQGMKNKQCTLPRGKVLGGSSTINNMQFMRGSPLDYDRWAANGCTGWSYEEVLPYFIKSETQKNEKYAVSRYHGTLGPIVVQDSKGTTRLATAFLHAAEEMGYKRQDLNGENQIGVMRNQININKGVRASTASAYLRPAMTRPNLHVIVNAHVTQVLFEGDRAVGVSYTIEGKSHTVQARREVILSAGAIATPQLLMISGVGPKEHLEEHQIPVVADLPVGNNLQDHMYAFAPMFSLKQPVSLNVKAIEQSPIWEYARWKITGTGYLATTTMEAVGFIHTRYQNPKTDRPAIQLALINTCQGANSVNRYRVCDSMNMNHEDCKDVYFSSKPCFIISPFLLRSAGTGTVRLSSKNPFHYPKIDPHYLEDEQGLLHFVDGVRIAQRIANGTAMQALGAQLRPHELAACKHLQSDSDEFWACFLRHHASTVYHHVGTCKMGPEGDATAVVDPQLRVRGLRGLRVVDASIMPEVPSGNTNSPTIMIGEKASDIIKAAWSQTTDDDTQGDDVR